MRFDMDKPCSAPAPAKSGFASLPWIVRWAIYFICFFTVIPPLVIGSLMVIGILYGVTI